MPLFDRKDKSRYATFTRRTVMMSGGVTAVMAVLGGRLYQLQIVNGEEYMTRAEENRVSRRLLAPLRGRILDRFGTELASNRRNYRVLLIPEQVSGGVEEALDTIGRIIVLTPHDRERILRDIADNKKFVPATVAENLSWEEFSRVNLHLPYLSGIVPDVGQTRDYPYGNVLSHVLGYVAAVSEKDMQNDSDPMLSLPGFRIGKRGIEKSYDSAVRGTAGTDNLEVNAYGRVIRELGRDPGTPGADVYLTIDNDLQRYAAARMGDESAAMVVMDITNGDVLALVSFKPVMALSALAANVIDENFTVDCTGSLPFGNYVFHCWEHHGHGRVNVHTGIQRSCDIFFYEVARKLGIDLLEAGAHRVGLGQLTHIEIPGEASGVVPGRAWKLAKFGAPWAPGDTLNAGIGQGFVTASPIQLATVAARIASGNAVVPRITRVVGKATQPRPELKRLDVPDKALQIVQAGMNAVLNEPGGTAYSWRIAEPGFEMAGKTGTAQVHHISKEERNAGGRSTSAYEAKLPWKLREHALFIAFAPVQMPRYAASIILEHGSTLSHPHVQMVRDTLLYAQKRQTAMLPTSYPSNAAENYVQPSGLAGVKS